MILESSTCTHRRTSPDAPGGHCPACLLLLGLAAGVTGLSAAARMLEPGDRVGRYQLLEKIGEGGCGIVFLAEQSQPLQRRVALKVIKPGMDTRQVIARFEAERQMLALLDHPHIARVFDASATESGHPFFVMEFVPGAKITEYCERKKVSLRERLALFNQVCKAVQHAHQKGVIHRDLKPSNILVFETESGAAMPKIIDFGIAKSTTQPFTDKTLFTAYTQFLGTPAYMSPEQAGTGGDIDTRSDIYSLGVLLCELLTGRTPFGAAEFQRRNPEEVLRLIREEEPVRPSALGGNLFEPHWLRGELDWIVIKCLEKDRSRRYPGASALACDIERYLANEPVVARPPSNIYRFQKTVQRHRLVFGAVVAVIVTLMLGVVASSYQAIRATRAENLIKAEAARNEQQAKYLADILRSAGPSVALGRDTTILREIVDRAASRATRDLADQPEVAAQVRNTLAETYHDLGLYHQMETMARESLRLSRTQPGGDTITTAKSLALLADALTHLHQLAEAETRAREALALRQKLLGAEHPDVSASLSDLGLVLREGGKAHEAEQLFRQAIAMDRKILGAQHPKVATDLSNLGAALWSQHKLVESETAYREALTLRRKIGGEQLEIATSLNNLATVLASEGKLTEAEALSREALALDRKYLAPNHPQLAVALDNLGTILSAEGHTTEAATLQREARAITKTQ